jgi:hypothetical protein
VDLAAAVYLGDADLFTEHVRWLGAVLSARGLPHTGVGAVLDVLSAELHDFPWRSAACGRGATSWPRYEQGAGLRRPVGSSSRVERRCNGRESATLGLVDLQQGHLRSLGGARGCPIV